MLSDPRLSAPIAALTALAEAAELVNDPMTHGGTSGGSAGKPSSKPPGSQQCEWVVRECERVLERAVKDCTRALNNAKVRDRYASGESDYTAAEKDAARRIRVERGRLIASRKRAEASSSD